MVGKIFVSWLPHLFIFSARSKLLGYGPAPSAQGVDWNKLALKIKVSTIHTTDIFSIVTALWVLLISNRVRVCLKSIYYQIGQWLVSGDRMYKILVNRLEDQACPVSVVR